MPGNQRQRRVGRNADTFEYSAVNSDQEARNLAIAEGSAGS